MREFVSGLIKAGVTVALLAAVTHLLHMQWVKPAEETSTSPQIVQPNTNPAPIPIPTPTTTPRQLPPTIVPKPAAPPKPAVPVNTAPSPEEQMARGRAELMALTEKADLEGLRAFVQRNETNRNMTDWVYVAKERIPLIEHDREVAALNLVPAKLRDAFSTRDINAVRVLIPNLTPPEAAAISQMFEKCKSVELIWGRGGAYLARGKSVAEINQELELRVVTNDGETLRARRNWIKIDLEKSTTAWTIRKARWHQSSNKGNFTAFDMPELP
ncbi:MAG: hypothetical protein JST93_19955 [Acidobacteria bacterium]|nr:hypothetical protein [Acidobacteriota bacterium]